MPRSVRFSQISASAGPIPRVDDTQARLPSSVRSDSKRVDQRSAESVEDVAHIRERFGLQASHDHRYRLAQFGARLPRAHGVLHYRYNMIQSDVKLIIDFPPPTSKRYHADASRLLPFRDCEAKASIVPRAIFRTDRTRTREIRFKNRRLLLRLSGYWRFVKANNHFAR